MSCIYDYTYYNEAELGAPVLACRQSLSFSQLLWVLSVAIILIGDGQASEAFGL